MILRVLHPRKYIPLFGIAWKWRESYPRRVRQWDIITTFDAWLEKMQERVSVGVFAPNLIALVTLEPTEEDVYEVHVDCERGVERGILVTALLSMQRTVFEEWGAREVFAGVVSKNCGILDVARECGFTPDGISEQVGRLKFIRLRMTDVQYKDRYEHRIDYEHIHPRARSFVAGHRSAQGHEVSG